MRNLFAVLAIPAIFAAAPAAAQTFHPAVVSTNLPPMEALWHLRVALNVAALGCRDANEGTTVASYNALVRNQTESLAAANAAIDARYKAQFGADWLNARERDMTRLYNYFAQPSAQVEFCAVAKDVLMRIGAVEPSDLAGFALASLPALEEPFWPQTDRFAGQPTAIAVSAVVPPVPR